jgi:hypothetical protein
MPFIEAPTTFYLGREYDPEENKLKEDVVYYDSRDLTTHAVVVGMTGSGKTGLCINMLEEAILDNIPAIIIDPKGDITNLMLNFPDLKPEDFQPWINADDARRARMDLPNYAADVAQQWRDGLASWGIVPDRLRWLKAATQYSIYTPGSDAGLPVNIVASLRAPREGWAGNEEMLREKINAITTALLALAGINADPIKDPEHVLISNIFEHAWKQGKDLTLEELILQIRNPPFDSLGVVPINDFMSERKRSNLMMDMNNIIAAPSFQSWLQGDSLDMQRLLYQPNGRPRVSIFYIAHLADQERMFITTLLLQNMLSWMRTLGGTTSLRAILYVDEMFGYFPPYPKNPPTKEPILRLLKQARAFGIGLILATQNPGDLDYKGLTNAGTWFIGRLQSDNDKKKIMAGLRQLATADEDLDLNDVGQMISDIAPRVFLMRNVHDTEAPTLVHTRWAMSFLRGPLTRQQVSQLMQSQRRALMQRVQQQQQQPQQAAPSWQQQREGQYVPSHPPLPSGGGSNNAPPPTLPGQRANSNNAPPPTLPGQRANNYDTQNAWNQQSAPQSQQQNSQLAPKPQNAPQGFSANQPPLSSSTAQFFIPARLSLQEAVNRWQERTGNQAQQVGGHMMAYKPVMLGQAIVRYQEKKASIYTARTYAYFVPEVRPAGLVHWDDFEGEPVDSRSVEYEPTGEAVFGEVSSALTDSKRMKTLERELKDMLYNTGRLAIPFNPELKIYGDPDADYSEFQANVYQAAREGRDTELDKLSERYGGLMEKLEEKRRRKEQELRAEKKEIRDRKREELFTTGEALFSLWKGRTNYTLSRMSRATRYRRQAKEDIQESYEFLDEVEQEMAQLEQEFERELAAINDKWTRIAGLVEEHLITPYKKDIQIELFGIGWLPAYFVQIDGRPVIVSAM